MALSLALDALKFSGNLLKKVTKKKSRRGPVATTSYGGAFQTGAEVEILSQAAAGAVGATGDKMIVKIDEDGDITQVTKDGRRRRRRRLLSAQDKVDIAFMIGVLGKGQLANTAISVMLSRR